MGMFSLGGIGSFITDAASSAFNAHLGRQNARNNAALSLANWKYMQSNAHQLEVEDLKNAGLNPILSATNSQIAGMGSVSGQNGSSDGLGSSILAAASAKELKRMDLENELLKTKVDAAKNGITVKNDGSIERTAADERFGAGTDNLKADTRLKNVSSDYTSAKQSNEAKLTQAEFERIQNDIRIANEKLPYEINKIVADTENARATASYMLSMVKLNAAKIKMTDKQREQIEADLKDPKKLMDKQFWENVFHSNEEKFRLLRASYERGLSNDVYFNFYANSQGSGLQDANDLATIGARIKYFLK
jgi:hypothetical protein|nr:MAG TPA_asm: minor capsid protein [Microviridae sp.]